MSIGSCSSSRSLTVGSLFAGIGGFDLAARWMGWQTKWYSEIDPYACAVMRKHFPDATNLGDVTAITQAPPVDLLCGGFPCQDISLAGKGAGIDGERSGLWSHFARLIGEVRPRWVVAENVAALRSRGLDRVLQELDALGYDAEWHCIPASYVGAPHRRDRIWIVAHARSEQLRLEPGWECGTGWTDSLFAEFYGAQRNLADADGEPGNQGRQSNAAQGSRGWDADRSGVGALVGNSASEGLEGREQSETTRPALGILTGNGVDVPDANDESQSDVPVHDVAWYSLPESPRSNEWWGAEPDVGRVANGIPARVDRLRCLGNAIVPQVAALIFSAIQEIENSRAT